MFFFRLAQNIVENTSIIRDVVEGDSITENVDGSVKDGDLTLEIRQMIAQLHDEYQEYESELNVENPKDSLEIQPKKKSTNPVLSSPVYIQAIKKNKEKKEIELQKTRREKATKIGKRERKIEKN